MELKQLVESYRYLKTFVGVYGAYKEEHAEFASDDWMIKMDRKYNAAKAFLSYIEKAITVLPINTRSNYNNQYEMLYRKVYMEEVKIKDIAEQLNTSRRNAYSIKAHALEMIEERVALLFNTTYQITPLPVPKNLSVTEGFRRCGNAEIDSYYEAIIKAIHSQLGVIEGNFANAFLLSSNSRQIAKYIRISYPSMTRSAYIAYYRKVSDYIGVCLYGFDYLSSQKGYVITEKECRF